MSKKCCEGKDPSRLNKVGGQAVLEGVMMKAGTRTVTTCRKEDGTLAVTESSFISVRKKHKILDLPILRGVVNFVEMMILSVKTLNNSAEALGLEEESKDGKEGWLKKHLGISVTDLVMGISVILALGLAVVLFKILPALVADGVNYLFTRFLSTPIGGWRAVVEGFAKIAIFLTYLWLTSLVPDIKRTFMYHGAEHKSIACFEAGDELTPENAAKHKRFHPRCGTSFMFLMIAIGILVSLAIRLLLPDLGTLSYIGISLLTLPLTMGIGYEFLMIAGKHDNAVTRAISTPGLWVQRITTKEPTLDMLEVAIVSLKGALRSDFPEYDDFFRTRAWEKTSSDTVTDEPSTEGAEAVADSDSTDSDGDGAKSFTDLPEIPIECGAHRAEASDEGASKASDEEPCEGCGGLLTPEHKF